MDSLSGGGKLQRAHGGCLGRSRRRRAWQATIRLGEPQAGYDPGIPELRNLRRSNVRPLQSQYITLQREPGEVKHLSTLRKRNQTEIPLVVASERGTA